MKQFDQFVQQKFGGYSAHTLWQDLVLSGYPKEVVSQWVYVNIWHIFTGKATPGDHDIGSLICRTCCGIDETEEQEFLCGLYERHYCREYGYEYPDEAWLKDHALEWYLKGAISLSQFKEIVG